MNLKIEKAAAEFWRVATETKSTVEMNVTLDSGDMVAYIVAVSGPDAASLATVVRKWQKKHGFGEP